MPEVGCRWPELSVSASAKWPSLGVFASKPGLEKWVELILLILNYIQTDQRTVADLIPSCQ